MDLLRTFSDIASANPALFWITVFAVFFCAVSIVGSAGDGLVGDCGDDGGGCDGGGGGD